MTQKSEVSAWSLKLSKDKTVQFLDGWSLRNSRYNMQLNSTLDKPTMVDMPQNQPTDLNWFLDGICLL